VSVVFVVLPIAMVLLAGAIGAYAWAARHGQFDDLTTPAMRALDDDDARGEQPPAARPPGPGSAGP
jgi:cbb3-type cytochrome oxidase maturation protein